MSRATFQKSVYVCARRVLEFPVEQRRAAAESECAGDARLFESVWDLVRRSEEGGSFLDFSPVRPVDAGQPEGRMGPYRVLRELGRGGMGQVLLAERDDGQFTKRVALKVMLGYAGGELRQRFLRERQILANLEHPGIARLLDGGETAQGAPYLAMEYVEGRPVQEYCEAESLTVRERVRLFARICEAVEYAHRQQVVHRDLKPSNLLVTPEGQPKLLDFGIAKLLEQADEAYTLTGAGMLTPAYASPEQLTGGEVTPRTDVYSLGVVMYEALTGRLPYAVRNLPLAEALRVPVEQPPTPAGKVRAELRGDVERILARALEKEPSRRYASATELREDLERYLAGEWIAAGRGSWIESARGLLRRYGLRAAVAALAVATLTAGTWMVREQQGRAERSAGEVREMARRLLVNVESLGNLSGSLALRGQLAADASQYLDQAGTAVESPEVAREVADAYRALAHLQGAGWQNLGDLAGAIRSLHRSIELREATLSRGDDAEVRASLAIDLAKLGTVYGRAGDARLEPTVARALAVFEALPRELAQRPDVSAGQAEALNSLSYVHATRGEMGQAIAVARRYAEFCARAERPGNLDSAIRTAHARQRLADYLQGEGALKEATQLALASTAGLEALKEAQATPELRRRVRYVRACASIVLGKARRLERNWEGSLTALAEAVKLFEGLLAEDPGEHRTSTELVDALLHRAMVWRVLARKDAEQAALRRLVEVGAAQFESGSAPDADPVLVDYWRQALQALEPPLDAATVQRLDTVLERSQARRGPRWAEWRKVTENALTLRRQPSLAKR